jgi:hypothetical protein
MGIRYDHTPDIHTAYCDCGWIDLSLTREGAWRIALEHESRVHPHRQQVREAAKKREQRAADTG